jgi:putative CocE/NonD family hydrolase
MLYVMGPFDGSSSSGNVWRRLSTWPPPSQEICWFFSPDGMLTEGKARPEASRLPFEHDPDRPVPTLGGSNLFLKAGPMDQRPIESRDDVVVFTTPALPGDLEVIGRVRAKVWLSTEADDTDVAVRLCDVYPDGRSILICDGIRRLSTVASFPETTGARQPVEVEIDLWSTSIVFALGHKIRVSISGSNWPRFAVDRGFSDMTEKKKRKQIQKNTLWVGGEHNSRLILPVTRRES